MLGTFFRHGATAALAACALALAALIAFGFAPFRPLDVASARCCSTAANTSCTASPSTRRRRPSPSCGGCSIGCIMTITSSPAGSTLLFLPLWFLVPNLAVTAALIALALGPAATASTMLGVVAAILHYEWTHYVAHTAIRPLTPLGRWIKQYHLRHHFISEKLWFGVSNPSLDVAFGTFRRPDDARRSATARNLHLS